MKKLKIFNAIFPTASILTITMLPTVVHFTVPEPAGPDKVFTTYCKQTLEEFCGSDVYSVDGDIKGICAIPRESGDKNYVRIANYLKQRVTDILGDDLEEIKIWPGTDDANDGDLIFDVKATPGCENWKPIILQGHMDMVLDGTPAAKETARKIGIVPFIDGHVMYSKNHETSLGADNGMGIAVMLSLLKNRNDFQHGPIRVICTSNEETTTGGAVILQEHPEVLFNKNGQTINHMINVDAEPRFGIYRSCAGLFDITTEKNDFVPEDVGSDWTTYDLWIGNLNGGHSAWGMEEKKANADRMAFEFLYKNVDAHGDCIKIISYDHTGSEPKSNQIIKNGHLVFATNLSFGQIETIREECLTEWTTKYTGDDFKNRVQFSLQQTKSSAKCLDAANSSKIIKFIGSNNDNSLNPSDLEKGLCYGILKMTEDDSPRPAASTNIGPIKIESDNQHVYFKCISKTRLVEESYIDLISNAYAKAWSELFPQEQAVIDNKMVPWVPLENNVLLDWMEDAYRKVGATPQPIDTRGGVEPAWWTLFNKNLCCICVGPEIQNAHSTSEICSLDTVDPCIRALMDVLGRMEEA